LQAEHEGFGAGALSALKTAANVLGSLADKIRVPDQYVVAIETALGHHLQLVLTEQPETARQISTTCAPTNRAGPASPPCIWRGRGRFVAAKTERLPQCPPTWSAPPA
jgi:chromosome segregation ATPase